MTVDQSGGKFKAYGRRIQSIVVILMLMFFHLE